MRENNITFLVVFFFVLAAIAFGASDEGVVAHTIKSAGLSIEINSQGEVVSALIGEQKARRELNGSTIPVGCIPYGQAVVRKLAQGVEFERTFQRSGNDIRTLKVINRFVPVTGSIRWEVEVLDDGPAWSTEIQTRLLYPASPGVSFWTAWSKPQKGGKEAWTDPLAAVPLQAMRFDYGAPPVTYDDPKLAWCPYGILFCMPLATLIESGNDIGISLVLSPEDVMRELSLVTSAAGEVVMSRSRLRLGEKRPVKFAMDLVAHEGDWRGGLRWMAQRYPLYFESTNQQAHEMAGTCAYSSLGTNFDAERMKKMAFRVNWKASFDFPYMGMFLPPVKSDMEKWKRFGGQETSVDEMAKYSAEMRRKGFYVLSYFNVTEFGARVAWPPRPPQGEKDEDLWKRCDDYLQARLAAAILRVPDRMKPGPLASSIYPATKVGGYFFTWEDGIVMDCGEKVFQDYLLEQARRHIEKVPDASGICIDRMDWTRMYNEQRDDGESWIEGKPARSLIWSWHSMMDKLGPLMHSAGKVVFVNNHVKRIDLLKHSDGIFDEFCPDNTPLNTTGLLAIRKPALGWVSNEGQFGRNPDVVMQRFLYMGVYPMAPFPANDHSLVPSKRMDQLYLDYGPLLDTMRGKRWVLAPHAIEVKGGMAKANLFEVPGGYVVPIVLGGESKSVDVILRNVRNLSSRFVAEVLHPGAEKWTAVDLQSRDGVFNMSVPLQRGCAMVRLR